MVKCTPRVLFTFFTGDFWHASTEKNTQQFQALNGLKCSTVGNLGSKWTFVIMLQGIIYTVIMFGGQSQKRSKFSNLVIFDLRIAHA